MKIDPNVFGDKLLAAVNLYKPIYKRKQPMQVIYFALVSVGFICAAICLF